VAGVINKEKLASFERVLWRIGRGTIFLRHSDVEELIFDSSTVIQPPNLNHQKPASIFREKKSENQLLLCFSKVKI